MTYLSTKHPNLTPEIGSEWINKNGCVYIVMDVLYSMDVTMPPVKVAFDGINGDQWELGIIDWYDCMKEVAE